MPLRFSACGFGLTIYMRVTPALTDNIKLGRSHTTYYEGNGHCIAVGAQWSTSSAPLLKHSNT